MKQYLLKFLFFLAYYIGIINLFYFITRKRQRIITYHNVIPDKYFDNSVTFDYFHFESVFDFQLNQIAKKFNFTNNLNIKNSCMITFDDGYKNNYNIAIPILEKYLVKAIFFITYDLVRKNQTLWIDLIMKWCSFVPIGNYKISTLQLEVNNKNRLAIFQTISAFVYQNYSLKEEIISLLDDQYSFDTLLIDKEFNDLRFSPLTIEQVAIMKKNKHKIACHTLSHDILSKLNNNQLEFEIIEAEEQIDNFYNSSYFAYPFGGIAEVSVDVSRRYSISKFKHCFVNYWNFYSSINTKRIERFSLPNTKNKYIIHAHLSGLYYFLKKKIKDV